MPLHVHGSIICDVARANSIATFTIALSNDNMFLWPLRMTSQNESRGAEFKVNGSQRQKQGSSSECWCNAGQGHSHPCLPSVRGHADELSLAKRGSKDGSKGRFPREGSTIMVQDKRQRAATSRRVVGPAGIREGRNPCSANSQLRTNSRSRAQL